MNTKDIKKPISKAKFLSYADARLFTRDLKLTQKEWHAYCKSGNKPDDIPANPRKVYGKQFKGFPDWLGTGNVANKNKQFRPFDEALRFAQSLGLKNRTEWRIYCKSGNKPDDIPSTPDRSYKNEWKEYGIHWDDWLGTGKTANRNKQFRSHDEAKKFIHRLRLKGRDEWTEYCKSGQKPDDIPYEPTVYGYERVDWNDWLGTGNVANKNKKFRPFDEARNYVHTLELENEPAWKAYCKSGKKPKDIPSNPVDKYEKEWINWYDWLGTDDKEWSVDNVKKLLRDLIESKIIYGWEEAVLYSFLLRKGVLNLQSSNRHAQFFKNLIQARSTEKGRKAFENYAISDSDIPPDLSQIPTTLKHTVNDAEQQIDTISSNDLSQLIIEDKDPLDYGHINTTQEILANTIILESINTDKEAIQFYLKYSIDELWKSAFRDETNTILAIRNEKKNRNRYHDQVLESFLSDYESTKKIKIPRGYIFPSPPTLMQLYTCYKVMTKQYFGNFSGTGAGKTLSAVLTSQVIDSKMTLIICPNDVVNQWEENIKKIFSNSKVAKGKDAFYTKYNEKEHQYLVLNYDKFSQEDSPNLILSLVKEKIDFVVLDEIHFVKRRDEKFSKRRKNLEGLLTYVRKRNRQVRVLGLSATPVVNNLMEGRSLLELITGKIYDDISTNPSVPNAVTLYEKLSHISIRELPQYNIDINTEHLDVTAPKPKNIGIKELKSNPLLIEKYLTNVKIPKIIQNIKDQTIIYTEYVTEIIDKVSKAVEEASYSFSLYVGSDHSGLKKFLEKRVQVLIASRPISTGVDKIQHVCNRLIINTLPWTNAQYQQLIGRLVRRGQIKDNVNVYVIRANIAGYPYDKFKWNRIQFKRTLADCAVDGRLPEKNLVTPQQASMEAVKWLERMERGEVSAITRRDLNVELTPIEIEHRIRKYGDFTRLNNVINNENSETTHKKFLENPQEWEEYHRQYREARKSWKIIPYEEIIKRLKQFSKRLHIGDFGCGEARIMEAIGVNRVYSFDHIAINDKVIECNMKKVPLDNGDLEIVILSLSLMGKNWIDYILEAKRCLATNGTLIIVETTKSLKGRLLKLRDIIKEKGFEINSDDEKGDFTFIEARKL